MAKRPCFELFVGRLSEYITGRALKGLFSPYGVVKKVRLFRDQKTQRHRGYGFVEFETEIEAQKALKAMNGRMVNGRLMFVEVAGSTRHGNGKKS